MAGRIAWAPGREHDNRWSARSSRPIACRSPHGQRRRLPALSCRTDRIRRDLHAHPELGLEEHRTAEHRRGEAGGSGASRCTAASAAPAWSACCAAATAPRRIGLRADMDALPMQEADRPAHAQPQLRAGCMPAAMTATPPCCWARRNTWPRPATSTARSTSSSSPARKACGGALAMLEDGLFERFPCDAIYRPAQPPRAAGRQLRHRPPAPRRPAARSSTSASPAAAAMARGRRRSIDPVLVGLPTSPPRCNRSSPATCRRPTPPC